MSVCLALQATAGGSLLQLHHRVPLAMQEEWTLCILARACPHPEPLLSPF